MGWKFPHRGLTGVPSPCYGGAALGHFGPEPQRNLQDDQEVPAPPPGTYINGRRFSDEAERRLEEFENVCAELGVRLPPNFTVAQWLESHGMSRSHFDRLRQSAPHGCRSRPRTPTTATCCRSAWWNGCGWTSSRRSRCAVRLRRASQGRKPNDHPSQDHHRRPRRCGGRHQ